MPRDKSNSDSKLGDLTSVEDFDSVLSSLTGLSIVNEDDLTILAAFPDDGDAELNLGLMSLPNGTVSSFKECFSL